MYIKAISFATLAFCATQVFGLDFSSSSWIWTNEIVNGNAPPGSRAFRNDWCPPQGKVPASASIFISTDNAYTLYINGGVVGTGTNWRTVGSYCVTIAQGCNTFALNATNNIVASGPDPGGILAAVQITYTDGTTSTLVSDSNWRYSLTLPAGFEQPGFDDSNWPFAVVEGPYGIGPWGTLTLPAQPTAASFPDANWIWTNEVEIVEGSIPGAPIGSRAFRKDITLPAGQTAVGAIVTITADNLYSLYVQGQLIGSGTTWTEAQLYLLEFPTPLTEVVIAVNATNAPPGAQAGLIATVQLVLTNDECGSFVSTVTDSSWKFSTSFPSGWQSPTFDDSAWSNAIVEGRYGVQPWGDVPIVSGSA